MGWAIHCREHNGVKRYAVFSTVVMGYLTRTMSRRYIADEVYKMDVKSREQAFKLHPESAPPPPSRERWEAVVEFASVYGNSEYFHHPKREAECVSGCRCWLHHPIPIDLHKSWW